MNIVQDLENDIHAYGEEFYDIMIMEKVFRSMFLGYFILSPSP